MTPAAPVARRRISFRAVLSLKRLHQAATLLTLALPFLLLHSRALTEVAIDSVAASFLIRSLVERRWHWLRQDWVIAGLLWWAWVIACSLLAAAAGEGGDVVQAALVLRFLLFVAALQVWVLGNGRERRWFLVSLSVATVYVGAQTLMQFATGYNLYGVPRYGDGSLTGPFRGPRAGPTFVRMLFPPLLFAVGRLTVRHTASSRVSAAALILAAVAVIVLIGQRMPVLLTVLGLFVAALLMPRIRRLAIVAVLAGAALIGASAVVSPPTFYRLVAKFSDQMEHFPHSHYGEILGRALAIAEKNPWTGLGFNGFQAGCPEPQYQHGWRWPTEPADDGGGAAMCVGHPHNHYLQALDDGGWPGLLLFCALLATWLRRLARGVWTTPDPLRVGLLAAAVIQEWPIASTSPLISLPIGGWFFLLLGYGLALSSDDPDQHLAEGAARCRADLA